MSNPEKFWLVWKDGWHLPIFKHPSLESAVKEAKRLSLKYNGCKFWVLEPQECIKHGKSKKEKKEERRLALQADAEALAEAERNKALTKTEIKKLSDGADLSAKKGTVLLIKK